MGFFDNLFGKDEPVSVKPALFPNAPLVDNNQPIKQDSFAPAPLVTQPQQQFVAPPQQHTQAYTNPNDGQIDMNDPTQAGLQAPDSNAKSIPVQTYSVLNDLGTDILKNNASIESIRKAYPELRSITDSVLQDLGTDINNGKTIQEISDAYPELSILPNPTYTDTAKSVGNDIMGLTQKINQGIDNEPGTWGVLPAVEKGITSTIGSTLSSITKAVGAGMDIFSGQGKTSDNIFNAVQGTAGTLTSIYAPIFTLGLNTLGNTQGGDKIVEGMGNATTWVGGILNNIPALQSFKKTLSPEYQEEFDSFIGSAGIAMLLGARNSEGQGMIRKGYWEEAVKNPKGFVTSNLNPIRIIKNFQESIGIPMEGLVKMVAGNPTQSRVLLDRVRGSSQVQKRLPEVEQAIEQGKQGVNESPIQFEKRVGKQYLDTLQNNVSDLIDEKKVAGDIYGVLNKDTSPKVKISDVNYNSKLNKYGLQINKSGKVEVIPGRASEVPDSALKQIQEIVDRTNNVGIGDAKGRKSTTEDTLTLRKYASSKAGFDIAPEKKGVVNSVLADMRGEIDRVAKRDINGLSELDSKFSTRIENFKKVTKDIFKYNKETNSYTLNQNAWDKLSKNPQLVDKINEVIPGFKDNIEAIKLSKDIYATGKKQGGGFLGKISNAAAGYIASKVLSHIIGAGPILSEVSSYLGLKAGEKIGDFITTKKGKAFMQRVEDATNNLSPEAKQRLEEISIKEEQGLEMNQQDRFDLQLLEDSIVNKLPYLGEQSKPIADITSTPIGNVRKGQIIEGNK